MGKHSSQGISYWEARRRRKDLRNRAKGKAPRRRGPTKKRWFVLVFVLGMLAGGVLGYYAKPIARLAARVYLAAKQKQWQPSGNVKREVEKSLTPISPDPDRSVNTLIIGSDQGSNKGEGGYCRSDVMMLVCLQERDKKAVVISIPRDTRVTLGKYGSEKINAAHSYGGPAASIDAVKQLTGIDIHHYISMNFQGFIKIIDAIGGVQLHLAEPIRDPHAGYLPAGDQLLGGVQALVVVRSRKFPEGDIDRIRNQQAFLRALLKKAEEMKSVWKAKEIVDIVASQCQMDYSAAELLTLAEELKSFDVNNVQFVTLPGTPRFTGGASYYIPDTAGIAQISSEVKANCQLSPDLIAGLQRADEERVVEEQHRPDADVITVLSGVRSAVDLVPTVAQGLRVLGHEKVYEGQTKQTLKKTTVYYRKEAKANCDHILKQLPELANADVFQSDEVAIQYNSPVVLVLGQDFSTPNIYAIYGRVMKPAVEVESLGKKFKSFS